MQEATTIIAIDIAVRCPHCGERTTGYLSDPRGEEFECEFCDKEFKIHKEADIEME